MPASFLPPDLYLLKWDLFSRWTFLCVPCWNADVQIKPFLSFQLLYCWSALAFLCRRSWGQLSLTNRDPSAKISRRDKRPKMVVPLPPSSSLSWSAQAIFQYVTFQGHWMFCCFLKSGHFVHIFIVTYTVIDRELESQQSYAQLLSPLEFLLNGALSMTVNRQCTAGNIIRVWLWSWFPLDIQTSSALKSSSQFVIFMSAVMVTVWGL